VSGGAVVRGGTWTKIPLTVHGSRHLLFRPNKTDIQIGCHVHMPGWWLENHIEIGKQEGYTDAEITEYRLYIDLFIAIINMEEK
jgi:hypothetical protein